MRTKLFSSLLLLAIIAPAALAQTAELHPGTMQGSVSLSGESVTGGWINVYSPDGFSAAGSLTGASYSLTVEGAHSYYVSYLSANMDQPNGSIALQIGGNPQTVLVPVGGTGTLDISYAVARIAASVSVAGGTLDRVDLRASSTNSSQWYDDYGYYYDGSGSYALPMVVGTSVRVFGTAYVHNSSGVAATQSLETQTIDLGAAGASVHWDVDLNAAQTGIAGTANVQPSSFVFQHSFQANGVWGTPTAGRNAWTYITGNGPYSMLGLAPGSYYVWAYTFFNAPYGYLQHAAQQVDVTAGSVTTKDWTGDLGFIHGALNVTGFVTNSRISSGSMEAQEIRNGYAGYAYDYLNPADATFDLAVTSGQWAPYRYSIGVSDFSDPARPLNAWFYGTDSTYMPWGGGTPLTVAANDHITIPTRSMNTVESQIVVDVVEPAGAPQTMINNAWLWAYSYTANSSKQFSAYGPWSPMAQPAIRIIGEPGDYNVDVWGNVNGSQVKFASFPFHLDVPIQTGTGTNVPVSPVPGVDMTFSNVTSPGVTTVTEAPVGPQAPPNFKIASKNGSPVYYDITTTATFSGPVTVCIDYDDSALTAPQEKQLKLYHFDSTTNKWANITSAGYPDTTANRICGVTSSFSIFALAYQDDTEPPVITAPANKSVSNDPHVCGASVDPGTATATDNVAVASVVGVRSDNQALDAVYPVGTTTIVWTATDTSGNSSSASQTITVNDTEPPSISGASLSTTQLWPVDHKMVDVTVSYAASDNCDPVVTTSLSIAANEPTNTLGDGNTSADWQVIDNHHIRLRAERSGTGSGRTYTVTITASDSKGNTSTQTLTCVVPKSM